jgi:hypothetical protein
VPFAGFVGATWNGARGEKIAPARRIGEGHARPWRFEEDLAARRTTASVRTSPAAVTAVKTGNVVGDPDEKTISLLAISVSHLEEHWDVQLELPLGLKDEARRPGTKIRHGTLGGRLRCR